jgi:hypothetical protein
MLNRQMASDDRLVVDIIYNVITTMRQGARPNVPAGLIVNLSPGKRRCFALL